ncbi:hypothetical protein J5N97_019490 [Dioscorea zingiberensis]|uniref:Uncharacterized protein n=1 Tax=Dioscorea zingiberensis TaxID=325984 RepID=A0A9D5CE31_9LILI|nr:hypothetical protein J5N97_019490 [Dioscorea zingiberensis]
MESIGSNKRSREVIDVPEEEPSHDAKRFREELIINILDDDDDADDRNQATQDLDTVIKSLQKEIIALPSPKSNDRIRQPDLGYLLEASDDELGLPPEVPSSSEEYGGDAGISSADHEVAGFARIWGFEDEAFDFGFASFDDAFGYNDAFYEPLDLFDADIVF